MAQQSIDFGTGLDNDGEFLKTAFPKIDANFDELYPLVTTGILQDLTTLGPNAADGEFLVGTGAGAFAWESGATVRTSLGVYSTAEVDAAIAAAVTAEDLDFQGDSGGALSIDLDSETLTVAGGTGISTAGATNTLTVNVTGVLEDLVTLGAATADGQFIVATGAGAFAYESGATARASLSVYSSAETDAAIAAAVTAEDLDFQGDSGGALSIDLDSEVLTLAGGTGIATTGAANTVTFAVTGVLEDLVTLGAAASDGQIIVATGAGAFAYESGNTARTSLGLGTGDSPQFTALTLTGSPLALADNAVVNWGSGGITATHVAASDSLTWSLDSGGLLASTTYTWQLDGSTIADLTSAGLQLGAANARVTTILDEDAMGSNSATALATQQSIKAYVDAQVTAQDLDFAGDAGTGAVDLDSQTFTVATSNNSLATSAASQTLTIALANVLEDIDTLGPNAADSEFLVGTEAGALAWESGATVRTSLGLGTGDSPQFTAIELSHATQNTLTGSAGILSIEGVAIPTISSSHTLTNKSIDLTDNTLAGSVAEFNTALESATFGTFAAAQTDNALVKADGTGGLLQSSGITVSDTQDITAYDATADGNPVFSYGSSASNRLTITPTYVAGTVLFDYVLYKTYAGVLTADAGLHRFNVDEADILDIDDGGINLAASRGISIAGTDILTDAAGTATLSNIDVIDATTGATIEAGITTLASLTSIQGVAFTFGSYAATLLNNTTELGFQQAVNLEIGVDVQAFGAVLDDFNTLGAVASDGQFIVGTGAGAFAYESGNTARTSLGLGTGDSPQLTGLTLTGNETIGGYLRVGSTSAPTNTTAGDLTCTRIALGNGGLGAGNGNFVNYTGTLTDTAAASRGFMTIFAVLTPASASSSDFRTFNIETQPNAAGIDFSKIQAGWFGNRAITCGNVSEATGVRAIGLHLGSSSGAIGTVTQATAFRAQVINNFGGTASGTVTAAYGVRIEDVVNAGGSVTVGAAAGLAIDDQTEGTDQTNALLGTTTIPSGTWSLYSASTADSYFTGNLAIGATTVTGLLTLTQGTANTEVIASTGYSLTGSDATSMIDLAGTWNTTGLPTAISLNITDTASDANSLLMDLQVGGATKMSLTKAGYLTLVGQISAPLFGEDAQTSDAAASPTILKAGNAYAQASTNTDGADASVVPGIGRRFVTIVDYTGLGTDTVTVTIDGSDNVLTEGSEWTAATSNDATASSLASAVDALTGVSATAVSAVVYITPDEGTLEVRLAVGDGANSTATSGTDGVLYVKNLPTADPGIEGVLWNNSGTITVSAG